MDGLMPNDKGLIYMEASTCTWENNRSHSMPVVQNVQQWGREWVMKDNVSSWQCKWSSCIIKDWHWQIINIIPQCKTSYQNKFKKRCNSWIRIFNTNGKIRNLEKKNKNMHKIKMQWMKYANKLSKIK